MGFFSKIGSDDVRLADLERRVAALEDRIPKLMREVLEATEVLDRVTKRAFRLQQQTQQLELQQKASEEPTDQPKEVTRAQILRQYGRI